MGGTVNLYGARKTPIRVDALPSASAALKGREYYRTTDNNYYVVNDAGNAWVNRGPFESPFEYQGDITANSDFPTSALVQKGWFYTVRTNVTDNDGSKTNTGQILLAGDEIVWDGSAWIVFGNILNQIQMVSVSNIDDPSTELNAIAGTSQPFAFCYKTVADKNEFTLYAWDTADSGSEDVPYSVDGSSGIWIAIAGKYVNGPTSQNNAPATGAAAGKSLLRFEEAGFKHFATGFVGSAGCLDTIAKATPNAGERALVRTANSVASYVFVAARPNNPIPEVAVSGTGDTPVSNLYLAIHPNDGSNLGVWELEDGDDYNGTEYIFARTIQFDHFDRQDFHYWNVAGLEGSTSSMFAHFIGSNGTTYNRVRNLAYGTGEVSAFSMVLQNAASAANDAMRYGQRVEARQGTLFTKANIAASIGSTTTMDRAGTVAGATAVQVEDNGAVTTLKLQLSANCTGTATFKPAVAGTEITATGLDVKFGEFTLANDTNSILADLDQIVNSYDNTDGSSKLYLNIDDEGGGFWSVQIYDDAGRSNLVAHTANFNANGAQGIVDDAGAPALGGSITIQNFGSIAADVDIDCVFNSQRYAYKTISADTANALFNAGDLISAVIKETNAAWTNTVDADADLEHVNS